MKRLLYFTLPVGTLAALLFSPLVQNAYDDYWKADWDKKEQARIDKLEFGNYDHSPRNYTKTIPNTDIIAEIKIKPLSHSSCQVRVVINGPFILSKVESNMGLNFHISNGSGDNIYSTRELYTSFTKVSGNHSHETASILIQFNIDESISTVDKNNIIIGTFGGLNNHLQTAFEEGKRRDSPKKSELNFKDGITHGETSKEDNDNNRLLTEIQDVSKLNLDPNASAQSPILNRKIESREALGELELFAKQMKKKSLLLEAQYHASLAEVNYEAILDPHRVKADLDLSESKRMISQAKKARNKLNVDLLALMKETEKDFSAMSYSKDEETEANFQRGMERGLKIVGNQHTLELSIINEQEKLLDFLHKKRTSWTIVEDRFIFDKDEDLKIASEYLTKVVKLGLEQEEVTKQSVATTNENLEKLKTPTIKESDLKQYFEMHMKHAPQGGAEAQFKLYTEDLNKDPKNAFERDLKAAEQGDGDAQFAVGFSYQIGNGVMRDPKKAFEWYLKAAEQGDGEAQYVVGVLYLAGQGVTKDLKTAKKWISLADKNGITDAKKVWDKHELWKY